MPWGPSEGANIREQRKLWDSQREREKKKRTFPWKALTSCAAWPTHRTKDSVNTKEELASCIQAHPHQWRQRGRHATVRAGRQGAILAPETSILHQTVSRLPLLTTSSWDPGLITSARTVTARDQLPRRVTWHTWDGALVPHPGKRVAGTGEVIKIHSPPGTVCSPSTWSPELLRPGKGTKRTPNRVCALAEYPRN